MGDSDIHVETYEKSDRIRLRIDGLLEVVQKLQINMAFFFQAGGGIRDLVRSRGLGNVYKRRVHELAWLPVALLLRVHGAAVSYTHLSLPTNREV